jgi:cytochrome c-type biogenesis protein CcmF
MPFGGAWLTFAGGVFVLGTIVQEFWRGMRARQAMLRESAPRALSRVVGKNRRRYGGYIIHVGIVAIFFGIAGSSAFQIEEQKTLAEGQEMPVGDYVLRYDGIQTQEDGHLSKLAAVVTVFEDGQQIATMRPEKRFYKKPQQPTTEIAQRVTLSEDLYLVLGSFDPETKLITLLAYVNPLVVWIWLGGLIMALGTVVAVWPAVSERDVRVYADERARVPAK